MGIGALTFPRTTSVSRHVVFDESSFLFASLGTPLDLDFLVLWFLRLPHPTLLLLQVPQRLLLCPGTGVPAPACAPARAPVCATRRHDSTLCPTPWFTGDGISPLCRTTPVLGRWSTTPSSWLMTLVAHIWSLVMLSGSPSLWTACSSPPWLPRCCL
jgi:hypothetical protein